MRRYNCYQNWEIQTNTVPGLPTWQVSVTQGERRNRMDCCILLHAENRKAAKEMVLASIAGDVRKITASKY